MNALFLSLDAIVVVLTLGTLAHQVWRGRAPEAMPGTVSSPMLLLPFARQWGERLGGMYHAAGLCRVGMAIVGADLLAEWMNGHFAPAIATAGQPTLTASFRGHGR